MLRLCLIVVTALWVVLNAPAALAAERMSGTYYGVGEVEGTTLTLFQQGTGISGSFVGVANGRLYGYADGDNVQGSLESSGRIEDFRGRWSASGFEIMVENDEGTTDTFSFIAARPPAPEPATQQPQAATPTIAAPTRYYLYDDNIQVGPLTAGDVLTRIAAGESDRETQVWTAELASWVPIDSVAEFAPALPPAEPASQPADEATYYLAAAGAQTGPFTREQVLLGVEQGTVPADALVWQPGMSQWVKLESVAEFASAVPQAAPSPVRYFLAEDGAQSGPFLEAEIVARIAEGRSAAGDLGWKRGLDEWSPLSSFPEFAAALAAVSPPPLPGDTGDHVSANAGDPLPQLIDGIVALMLPNKGEEERAVASACVSTALRPLSPEDRQMIVDAGFDPSTAQQAMLEEKYPGMSDAVDACFDPGDSGDPG